AIAPGVPAADRDLSAVPGLSHHSKQALLDLGIRNVGHLAGDEALATRPNLGWGLRTNGQLLRARARALLDGTVRRLPGRLLHLMPPRVDAGLYLLFDQDPVEGRLAVLGCLFRWKGREEFTVRAVTQAGPEAERAALIAVLGRVYAHLAEVD